MEPNQYVLYNKWFKTWWYEYTWIVTILRIFNTISYLLYRNVLTRLVGVIGGKRLDTARIGDE